jgi:ubiquinone/menaquinone biosynthesis C-methylase UbiE
MSGWTKKRDVMRRYDATAHLYDTRYAEEQMKKIQAALRNVGIEKDHLILDVGCGTGVLFDNVADKAENVVGLDISRRTLSYAKQRAKEYGNVHLLLADAEILPFKDNIFDRVFALTLIQNTPNPHGSLAEIRRVSDYSSVIVVTGLKKTFAKKVFEKLLIKANLRTRTLLSENPKCYVAVCTQTNTLIPD